MGYRIVRSVIDNNGGQLCARRSDGRTVRIENEGPAPVWLGDSGVDVAGGVRLEPGESFDYSEPEELFATSTSGATVAVIETDSTQ